MPRRLELDQLVPGDPDAVAERLEQSTRFSPTPYRGGPFTLGERPLKGRVGKGRLNLGLNRRDWWSLLQPTARASLEPAASGTHVRGEVGMPGWLVWLLRGVVVGGIPAAVGFATLQLLADGSPAAVGIAAGFAGFSALVGIFGTGLHVAHADAQVEELKAAVLDAARGTPAEAAVEAALRRAEEPAPTPAKQPTAR